VNLELAERRFEFPPNIFRFRPTGNRSHFAEIEGKKLLTNGCPYAARFHAQLPEKIRVDITAPQVKRFPNPPGQPGRCSTPIRLMAFDK